MSYRDGSLQRYVSALIDSGHPGNPPLQDWYNSKDRTEVKHGNAFVLLNVIVAVSHPVNGVITNFEQKAIENRPNRRLLWLWERGR